MSESQAAACQNYAPIDDHAGCLAYCIERGQPRPRDCHVKSAGGLKSLVGEPAAFYLLRMIGEKSRSGAPSGYLDGQFLVAMPNMADERFARSVILICAHSREGAMGIVVNKLEQKVTFVDLLVQLDIVTAQEAASLPAQVAAVNVVRGGPVESGRGFVLHSPDYFVDSATVKVDSGIYLTHTLDILRAIARGEGPAKAIFALGYAGWAAGQLESEIQRNDWLNCPAEADIVFESPASAKYNEVMQRIGIELVKLSSESGHA